jgi:hypothetical protein
MEKQDLLRELGKILPGNLTDKIKFQHLELDGETMMLLFEYFQAYGGELNNDTLTHLIREGIKSHEKINFL